MAEIIEILSSKGNGGQKFTVDTSGPLFVSIITQGSFECDNADYKSIFQKGDNLQIISAGIILPEAFALATQGFGGAPLYPIPRIQMYLYTEPSHNKYYPSIAGANGSFLIAYENSEHMINSYIDTQAGPFVTDFAPFSATSIPENFGLYLSIDPNSVRVSMVNVPNKLHATVQRIVPFVKVLHNLPLVT